MLAAALGSIARRCTGAQLAEAAAAASRHGWSAAGSGAARVPATWQAAARSWQLQPSRCVGAGVAGGAEPQVAAALVKARKLAGPVGVVAGVFGSIVGVGGGVIIVPAIVANCRNIPQR